MSKLLLNQGHITIDGIRFGVTDLNVITQRTKSETSDPNNNNDILIGRQTWTFSGTIYKQEGLQIQPSTAAQSVQIVIGDNAYVGSAFIIQISLVGRISNVIFYNISGEFVSPAYHMELVKDENGNTLDAFNWVDLNGDGLTDDWGITGNGTAAISVGLGYRAQRFSQPSSGSPTILQADQPISFDSGATYRFYLDYKCITNIAGEHWLGVVEETSLITLSGTQSANHYIYNNTHVATGSWETVILNIWGDTTYPATADYFLILIGKTLNSL